MFGKVPLAHTWVFYRERRSARSRGPDVAAEVEVARRSPERRRGKNRRGHPVQGIGTALALEDGSMNGWRWRQEIGSIHILSARSYAIELLLLHVVCSSLGWPGDVYVMLFLRPIS